MNLHEIFARYGTGHAMFHLSDFVYYRNGHAHLKWMNVLWLTVGIVCIMLFFRFCRTHQAFMNAAIPARYLVAGSVLIGVAILACWYYFR